MKKKNIVVALILAIVLLLVTILVSKSRESDEEIFVMAAASLQDVLTEVANLYESETGIELVLNFASSGTLRKGIEEGANPDIFLSASTKQMDLLVDQGLVEEEHQRVLVMNQVVLIGYSAESEPYTLNEVTDTDALLAIGDPDFVPAGRYALQVIQARGLEEDLKEHFLICKDVRQVLAYVSSGEAEFGMVYRTDAMTSDVVNIMETYDEQESGVVQYPAALLAKGQDSKKAQDFYNFLFSQKAKNIFTLHGFLTLED
ncbi:molybdate ABC transporter substrate-binding protein [Clostridia bacterium]|nr:molybdate ABC transporter substrate-binding protein [Clostridia bacterium]